MTRLIDADALRKNMEFICMSIMAGTDPYDAPLTEIDNAPTVPSPEFKEGYKQAIRDGKTNFSRPQGKWFPVSEGLPKFSGLYLICIDSLVTVMNFSGTHFTNRGGVRVEVDAWQPLPEPYKREADNDK